MVAMVAAGWLGYEIQSFETAKAASTVQVLAGEWSVYGDRGLTASAGCLQCGHSTGPSDSITVVLEFGVGPARDSGCTICGGYNVSAIGVNPPFLLLHVGPSTFPTSVPQNNSVAWNLTIEAPSVPGSYYLSGTVQGSSY
ncbi:MAG: hypothetical protein L3K18_07850 [Thermoplasmata archaeon]|nr:hypothetical protein [Thermoplasmata archaeon]